MNDTNNSSAVSDKEAEKKPDSPADTADTADMRKVPIDIGYAWIILLAATLEMSVLIGIVKCNGIFFVQFQKRFGSSASMTSLVQTFHNVGYSFTSLMVMTVGLKYMSNRTSVMIGGAVYGFCFLVTGLAEDFRILFITQGALNGISFAFIHPPVIAMLGVYFDKHRGIANSISNVGVSIGGLVFAPLVTTMFEVYAYTGTFLVVSGILFHLLICGALLRPTEFYTITRSKRIKAKNKFGTESAYGNGKLLLVSNETSEEIITDSTLSLENFASDQEKPSKDNNFKATNSPLYKIVTSNLFRMTVSQELPVRNKHFLEEPLLERNRQRASSVGTSWRRQKTESQSRSTSSLIENFVEKFDSSLSARLTSSDAMSASLLDINTPTQLKGELDNGEKEDSDDTTRKEKGSLCDILKHNIVGFLSVIFDFKLLKNPVFCHFLLCAGLMCVGVGLTIAFVPPLAKDLQISGSDTALLISVNNIVDILSRVVFGIISDRDWVRRSTILGLTAVAIGIPSHFVGLLRSYNSLMVYGVILGMFQGVYFALFAVVIVDYLKLENLKSTLGFTVLMQGIFVCAAYPVVGALRDATGSYVSSYHFLGLVLNISALLAFLLPVVEKWNNRRNQDQEELAQIKSSL